MSLRKRYLLLACGILSVLAAIRIYSILGTEHYNPNNNVSSKNNQIYKKSIKAFVKRDTLLKKHRLWDDIQRVDNEIIANREEWQRIVDKYNQKVPDAAMPQISSSIGAQIDEFSNSLKEEAKLQDIKDNIEGTTVTSSQAKKITLDIEEKRRQLDMQLKERISQEKVKLDEAYEKYREELLEQYTPLFLKNNLNKISGGTSQYNSQDLQSDMKALLQEKRKELDSSLAAIEKKDSLELVDELTRYTEEQSRLLQNEQVEIDTVKTSGQANDDIYDPKFFADSYNYVSAGLKNISKHGTALGSLRKTFEKNEQELIAKRRKMIDSAIDDITITVQNYGKGHGYVVSVVSAPKQGMKDITDKVLKLL